MLLNLSTTADRQNRRHGVDLDMSRVAHTCRIKIKDAWHIAGIDSDSWIWRRGVCCDMSDVGVASAVGLTSVRVSETSSLQL